MFSRKLLTVALAASLQASLWANPDETASHFPSTTQLFVSGRVLPPPEVMRGMVERLQLNPAVEYMMEQIPAVLPVSFLKDILPCIDGRVTVAWVRTDEKSVLDRYQNRERQTATYHELSQKVEYIGKDVARFQKKFKRLPNDWQEMVTKKVRKTVPTSEDGQFVLEKNGKAFAVTVKYADASMVDIADPPRYESGTGLIELKRKPSPPINLVLAFKCADEPLARQTFKRLSDEKSGLQAVDADHWTLAPDAETSVFHLQFEKGWLLASDNEALLTRYSAANATDSLHNNAHYRFQRSQLKGSESDADLFAFADVADFLNSTNVFGELPPSAKAIRSAGLVYTSTPSKASGLPTAIESEMMIETELPGALAASNATDNLDFLKSIPDQSATVYAFNLAETNALLNRVASADPIVADLVDGLWNKVVGGDLTRAEVASGTGWMLVETEILDQFMSGFRSAMSGGGAWNDLPAGFTLETPDTAVRDKLLKVLWSKLGDQAASHTVGANTYWMREDKEWAMAAIPRKILTTGRTSRRIFLRILSCMAGKEPSLAQSSTLAAFRSHLNGRVLFFSHQKVDWLYSLLKGLMLLMDSQSRPEAEVLGAYRDSYAAVTVEEKGLRLYSSLGSEIPTLANSTLTPAPELLTLRTQVASDFSSGNATGAAAGTIGDQGKLTACKSNLKNIATACEMWSTDNAGRYPKSLKQLTPNYLKTIPTCPAAGKDTYSAHFRSSAKPDNYSIYCWGHNHATVNVPNNRPAYNAMQGLVEK